MTAEKCPECGAWWRGYEHRCPPVVATNHASIPPPPPPPPSAENPVVTPEVAGALAKALARLARQWGHKTPRWLS